MVATVGSDDEEVSSPAKPSDPSTVKVADMAGHPSGYNVLQLGIDRLQSGSGFDEEVVNFVPGLLQLEAHRMASKEQWTVLSSIFKYELLDT